MSFWKDLHFYAQIFTSLTSSSGHSVGNVTDQDKFFYLTLTFNKDQLLR